MQPTIDVVIPVLGRPHRVGPVFQAVMRAATVPTRVTFMVDVTDQDTVDKVRDLGVPWLPARHARGWTTATFASKVNQAFEHLDAPYLAAFGDDVEPVRGWDAEVLATFERHPRAGVVGTNDRNNRRVVAGITTTHPVIRRAWVTGYGSATMDGLDPIFSEAYRHAYCDGELVHVARSRGAFKPCLTAFVPHTYHPQQGGQDDDTYRLGRSFMTKDKSTQRKRLSTWDPTRDGDQLVRGRRILLASHRLDQFGEAEGWLLDMHTELQRRGAVVTVWSPHPGAMANSLKAAKRLRERWDAALVSHATTVPEARRVAGVVVQTLHKATHPTEQPHPAAHVLVPTTGELWEHALDSVRRSGSMQLVTPPIAQGVNLHRFRAGAAERHGEPLRRILLASNAREGALQALQAAAVPIGATVQQARYVTPPRMADLMQDAQVVVGLGRWVIEAMACGTWPVVWDQRKEAPVPVGDGPVLPMGAAELVRAEFHGFSGRALGARPTVEKLTDWLRAARPLEWLSGTAGSPLDLRAYAFMHHDVVDTASAYLQLLREHDEGEHP